MKVADALREKNWKKQFSLELPALFFKFHNEFDNLENVKIDLKASSAKQSNQSGNVVSAKSKIESLEQLTRGKKLPFGIPNQFL